MNRLLLVYYIVIDIIAYAHREPKVMSCNWVGKYGMIIPLTKVPIYRKAKLESGRRELELIKKLGKLIKIYVKIC